jgi:nicotinate-nucleotide adenylyltransferase
MGVIGVFGGTFDPPHLGHLAAAQEAFDVAGLDRVLFVPSQQNPLKRDISSSSVEHRLAMTALAIAGDPRFELSRADVEHPGPSYTVDLLQRLHDALGQSVELAFIAGLDVLYELHRWRDPLRLLDLARMLIVQRPGRQTIQPEDVDQRIPGASRRIELILTPGVAISSSELRERISAGRPVRYLMPKTVAEYIREHKLYRAKSQESGVRSQEAR